MSEVSRLNETEDEPRHKKQQVDALDMLPYTLQQTQFDTLKVMSTESIMQAYNEQL